MNIITSVLKKIFDFFCGDWIIFWGVVITLIVVKLIEQLGVTYIGAIAGIIFMVGVSLSLVSALKKEANV
ncbi:hypothetical protein [Clostridium pasteurianum]|uniref:Uncharacterized protein n=1 Tax=Clostridium pasteurianum BC1 TaxID=86416 RepID=R4JY04_CLOPA|nr:hypothetical protein [Clostridium pasteurianum]AGK95158.1 hypothetical protein Clopa_0055 [Clostridium pasteurianum BC1]